VSVSIPHVHAGRLLVSACVRMASNTSPLGKYYSECVICGNRWLTPEELVFHMRTTHTKYSGLDKKPKKGEKGPKQMDYFCCRLCGIMRPRRRLTELGRPTDAGETKHPCFIEWRNGRMPIFDCTCIIVSIRIARALVRPYFESDEQAGKACAIYLPDRTQIIGTQWL